MVASCSRWSRLSCVRPGRPGRARMWVPLPVRYAVVSGEEWRYRLTQKISSIMIGLVLILCSLSSGLSRNLGRYYLYQ